MKTKLRKLSDFEKNALAVSAKDASDRNREYLLKAAQCLAEAALNIHNLIASPLNYTDIYADGWRAQAQRMINSAQGAMNATNFNKDFVRMARMQPPHTTDKPSA